MEILPDRIVPAVDIWIAPAGPAADWDVGADWTLKHSPQAGDNVVFQPQLGMESGNGSSTPCVLSAGDVVPTLGSLTLAANWGSTLTLSSNLATNQLTLSTKTTGGSDQIVVNQGSNLYSLQTLNWAGGSITGAGDVEVAGSASINGTNAADPPTLGAFMDVGTTPPGQGYSPGLLSIAYAGNAQPLVVQGNASISINASSGLGFANQGLAQGQTQATAVTNGDTLSHSLIINGGQLSRTNDCELFVCMGLDVVSGQVTVSNPQGQNSGNPLHFTGTNSDGSGLETNGGQLNLNADLTSNNYGEFLAGTVTVASNATLTLGINVNSPWSELVGTGNLALQGKLVAHGGGFYMDGGNLSTNGAAFANIVLDTGSTFELYGGEIDIATTGVNGVMGYLSLQGNFFAGGGKIVDNVNTSMGQANGFFGVSGNATLSTDAIFSSMDLNQYANNENLDWWLMNVGGTLQGDFTYSLPQNWTQKWNQGALLIHEP